MLNFDETTAATSDASVAAPERASAITPLDMRQTSFTSGWRGYSRQAVRTFLIDASEHYEQALRENERLRQEIARLESALKQYKNLEQTINGTLVHAQKVSEDLKAGAEQEAERLIKDAQNRAELLMVAAQNRVEDQQREIDGLRLRRREAEANVEAIIVSLQSTLEFAREPREARVVAMRPLMEQAS
jgi:cell division initiation protein